MGRVDVTSYPLSAAAVGTTARRCTVGVLNDDRDDVPATARGLQAQAQRGGDPLLAEFLAAVVYVERDATGSGLLVQRESDGSRWVYAYSVPDWVPGVDVGQDVDYASLTGRHLHALLPPGVGVRLDPGHNHTRAVLTPPTAATPPAPDTTARQDPVGVAVSEAVWAARAVRAGTGTREQVLAALRRSPVYVGRLPGGVPVASLPERGRWLCAFSSLELLLAELGSGSRYMLLPGCDLVDVLLPALAGVDGPIGVFLDLGAEHQLSLPVGLVGPASAIGPPVPRPAPRVAVHEGRRWRRQR